MSEAIEDTGLQIRQDERGLPQPLRVLVFTMVFPNSNQPLHGTFVLERVRHLAQLAEIQVLAPVPWYLALNHLPSSVPAPPIKKITHPIFWYLPRTFSTFRGLLLALSAIPTVRKLRKDFDFDLIDAHFAYPDGFAAVLLGKWYRRPVCITLRGTIVQWSRRPIGRWLCNWAIRRAERVMAVAESLANRARQGGVPSDRVTTIANGVDAERFKLLDRSVARSRLGLPQTERLLVSVGHISPRKGFHRVIGVLPRVIDAIPNVHLAIVGGKGAEEDNSGELRALAQRDGLVDRVLFVGAKPPGEVALWLAAADVFVLASDFEGCPNVVMEAMACGRPVVATEVGDIGRMVPTFAGILFAEPEDPSALAASLIGALSRDWDASRIREHVLSNSWDLVAEKVRAEWALAITSFANRSTGRRAKPWKIECGDD